MSPEIKIGSTRLHANKSHLHIADESVVVFLSVDKYCLVLAVRSYAEMVLLSIRFQILHKSGHRGRSHDEVACVFGSFTVFPKRNFCKTYRIFTFDYYELQLICAPDVEFHTPRHIVSAYYFIGYFTAVGIYGDDSRFVIKGLRVVKTSQNEFHRTVFFPYFENGISRFVRSQ